MAMIPPFGEYVQLPASILDPFEDEELDALADAIAVRILERLGHHLGDVDAIQVGEPETLPLEVSP